MRWINQARFKNSLDVFIAIITKRILCRLKVLGTNGGCIVNLTPNCHCNQEPRKSREETAVTQDSHFHEIIKPRSVRKTDLSHGIHEAGPPFSDFTHFSRLEKSSLPSGRRHKGRGSRHR
jgi:hypothetical protein